jgi:hypothetical protein
MRGVPLLSALQLKVLRRSAAAALLLTAVGFVVGVSLMRMETVRADFDVRQMAEALNAHTIRQEGGEALGADAQLAGLNVRHPWLSTVEYTLATETGSPNVASIHRALDVTALEDTISFRRRHIRAAGQSQAEQLCLAEAVYYEARGESLQGQLAVAEVVANRVEDHRYPNSFCKVVYQGSERRTGCQFTFTCDGQKARKPRGPAWEQAQAVAANIYLGLHQPITGGATHYHTKAVAPLWMDDLIQTRYIGFHIFYRFPRGGEWTLVRARQAERRAIMEAGSLSVSDDMEMPQEDLPPIDAEMAAVGTDVAL